MTDLALLLLLISEEPTDRVLWHLLGCKLSDAEEYEAAGFFNANWDTVGGMLATGTLSHVRSVCVEARKVNETTAKIVDELAALIRYRRNKVIRSMPALPERGGKA
jgi:hypothetical protein